MGLTRKALRAMGIEEDKIEQIIEMHTGTTAALQEKIDGLQAEAANVADLKKQLDALKTVNEKISPFEKQYNDLKTEYDNYKSDVENKQTMQKKESAVKAYLESKGIKGNNLKIAMRAVKDEINGVELDGDNIKDCTAFDTLLSGDFSGLVSKEKQVGANVPNPPKGDGSEPKKESKAAMLAKQYHDSLYGGKEQ